MVSTNSVGIKAHLTIAIGIHVYAEPERLLSAIDALRAHTHQFYRLFLLPDGPDQVTRQALRQLGDFEQLSTDDPRGVPACFNRLVTASKADVYVLLESGAKVSPGWSDCLLEGLAAHSRNGLAGPSTNQCWNAQGLFPKGSDAPAEIAKTAREVLRRFGTMTRTLEPPLP